MSPHHYTDENEASFAARTLKAPIGLPEKTSQELYFVIRDMDFSRRGDSSSSDEQVGTAESGDEHQGTTDSDDSNKRSNASKRNHQLVASDIADVVQKKKASIVELSVVVCNPYSGAVLKKSQSIEIDTSEELHGKLAQHAHWLSSNTAVKSHWLSSNTTVKTGLAAAPASQDGTGEGDAGANATTKPGQGGTREGKDAHLLSSNTSSDVFQDFEDTLKQKQHGKKERTAQHAGAISLIRHMSSLKDERDVRSKESRFWRRSFRGAKVLAGGMQEESEKALSTTPA